MLTKYSWYKVVRQFVPYFLKKKQILILALQVRISNKLPFVPVRTTFGNYACFNSEWTSDLPLSTSVAAVRTAAQTDSRGTGLQHDEVSTAWSRSLHTPHEFTERKLRADYVPYSSNFEQNSFIFSRCCWNLSVRYCITISFLRCDNAGLDVRPTARRICNLESDLGVQLQASACSHPAKNPLYPLHRKLSGSHWTRWQSEKFTHTENRTTVVQPVPKSSLSYRRLSWREWGVSYSHYSSSSSPSLAWQPFMSHSLP
jgi:hypothetical protein